MTQTMKEIIEKRYINSMIKWTKWGLGMLPRELRQFCKQAAVWGWRSRPSRLKPKSKEVPCLAWSCVSLTDATEGTPRFLYSQKPRKCISAFMLYSFRKKKYNTGYRALYPPQVIPSAILLSAPSNWWLQIPNNSFSNVRYMLLAIIKLS